MENKDKKVKIEVSERDLKMLLNIPVFFKKGTFPLNGQEILIAAQTQEYVGALINLIRKELAGPQGTIASGTPSKEPVKSEEESKEEKSQPKKRGRKPTRKAIVKE